MPMCRNKNVGNWHETSTWRSAKSRSGSRIVEWRAKRTAKDNKTSLKITTIVTAPIITTIQVIRVRGEVAPPVITATPITIQVITEVTMRRTPVTRLSLLITILIRPLPPQPQRLQLLQRLQVILVTPTAYLIPTIINDKRPFTPCEIN